MAKLHTKICCESTFHDFYTLYPEKFNNKTNGITHRRWFLYSNQKLSSYVSELIGEDWFMNPDDLEKLLKYKDDVKVLNKIS